MTGLSKQPPRPIVGIFLLALFSCQAIAAPEEIEVYLDDFSDIGKFGLDLHTNFVVDGQPPTYHQFRLTPELSYGVNSNWELAGYWLTATDQNGLPYTDGIKARARWRPNAPSESSPFYWAINYEIGQVSSQINPNESTGEIKLIGVWRSDPWLLGINLNYDRSIADHPKQVPTAEMDTKISYKIKPGFEIGWENYSNLGEIQNKVSQTQTSAADYLVSDISLGKWELNIGIGHVTGQTTDTTILKAIIGIPLY